MSRGTKSTSSVTFSPLITEHFTLTNFNLQKDCLEQSTQISVEISSNSSWPEKTKTRQLPTERTPLSLYLDEGKEEVRQTRFPSSSVIFTSLLERRRQILKFFLTSFSILICFLSVFHLYYKKDIHVKENPYENQISHQTTNKVMIQSTSASSPSLSPSLEIHEEIHGEKNKKLKGTLYQNEHQNKNINANTNTNTKFLTSFSSSTSSLSSYGICYNPFISWSVLSILY